MPLPDYRVSPVLEGRRAGGPPPRWKPLLNIDKWCPAELGLRAPLAMVLTVTAECGGMAAVLGSRFRAESIVER